MTILRERVVWRRKRKPVTVGRANRLTPEQIDNVRVALRVLHVRLREWGIVATALGVPRKSLEHVLYGPRKPNAGHAVRVARVAGVATRMCSAAGGHGQEPVRCAGATRSSIRPSYGHVDNPCGPCEICQ